jgi:transcriptional regulator with XRE-family HTH domain
MINEFTKHPQLMPWDELPQRLKSTREGRGLSLREAAEEVGVDASSWYRYESGYSTNNVTRWLKLTRWIEANLPPEGVTIPEGEEGCMEGVAAAIERDIYLSGDQKKALQAMMYVAYATLRDIQAKNQGGV